MVRSRESVLLEFDQLLNLIFPRKGNPLPLSEPMVDNAVHGFCRDAKSILPPSDLRSHALNIWLGKRDESAKSALAKSLVELLDKRLPAAN